MMKHAVVLGIGSDIGSGLAARLRADAWRVTCYHHDGVMVGEPWDLVICCYGVLEPIGPFWDADAGDWEAAVAANALLPLRHVRALYPHRRPGASVCFFSGAGASGPAPTYSAYAASKVMLTKMVELMDSESEDCKFFILGPGMMRTKIQEQTLRAGARALNYARVWGFMESGAPGTSADDVYACLLACAAAPKAAIGGRNVYVPLDDWSRLGELADYPDMFKLRRAGDADLRRRDPSEQVKGKIDLRFIVERSKLPEDFRERCFKIGSDAGLKMHRVMSVRELSPDLLEVTLSLPGEKVEDCATAVEESGNA